MLIRVMITSSGWRHRGTRGQGDDVIRGRHLGLGFTGSAILDTDDYTGRHLGYANSPKTNSQSQRSIWPVLAHTTTSYLLFKDASFPVLKCTVTIRGHMQDFRDCPMSLLIKLWYTPIILWTQEQVSTLKRLNPVGVNSNFAKSTRRDSEGSTYRHTLTREWGVSGEEGNFLAIIPLHFALITQCCNKKMSVFFLYYSTLMDCMGHYV